MAKRVSVSRKILGWIVVSFITGFVLYVFYKYYTKAEIKKIVKNDKVKQYDVVKNKKEYKVDQEDAVYYTKTHYGKNYQAETEQNRANIMLNQDLVENFVIQDFLEPAQTPIQDTQNVHDTSIQNNLKNRYKEYNMYAIGYEDVHQEIINRSNRDPKILKALDLISERNSELMNFEDETELSILEKTWRSGNDNVKDQILVELKDCISSTERLYCPTGVASRIVSATYIEDPDNFPKDKNSLNTEILAKCSLIKQNNPEIHNIDLMEEIVMEYAGIHDRKFISDIMSPWIDYV